MTESREDRIKRLTYRAGRRGFKEADLLIGGFAHARLSGMSDAEMDAFEALMNESDRDIYGWVVKGEAAPAEHDTPILAALRAFADQGGPGGLLGQEDGAGGQ